MTDLAERYRALCKEISDLQPSASLLAVTKGRSESAIRELASLGQKDFGESYWQELESKQLALSDLNLRWHFIGRLQSNKCFDIAKTCDWVHSVCQIKHAKLLSEARPSGKPPLSVCVQVNVSGEASKDGLGYNKLFPFVEAISAFPNLKVQGLMTLLPGEADEAYQQVAFSRCALWAEDLEQRFEGDFSCLSMGMSRDYQQALRCGARWCRIGGSLFVDI